MPAMTAQQIFDKVTHHLYTQRRRAITDDGLCLYRAPNGDKCAIGCLISDDQYEDWMDATTPGVCNFTSILFRLGIGEHCDLCQLLQDAHDLSENWDATGPTARMVRHLEDIARAFELSTTLLEFCECQP